MLKGLLYLPEDIGLSPSPMPDEIPDILEDGIIGRHHGQDQEGGKAQTPHDGRGQRAPKDGLASQTECHGRQPENGGQGCEDNGSHAHMAGPDNGQIELLGVVLPVPVDEIDQDQGVVHYDPRKGQEPDQGNKGHGVLVDQ